MASRHDQNDPCLVALGDYCNAVENYRNLSLAGGAEVGASASDDNALDGCFADAAGLTGTGVDVVVELEEAGYAVGVYVVGD